MVISVFTSTLCIRADTAALLAPSATMLLLLGHGNIRVLSNYTETVCHHCLLCGLRICSAKALSKYTEMVDNLIRQQKDKLEAASDEARLRLREWDMPEALQVPPPPPLPVLIML